VPKDKPEEPDKTPGKPVRIHLSGKATASVQVRARLIQHSPDADPKLVEVARQMARELKEKHGDVEEHIDYIPEAPLVLPDHK
jgi:hypothetical protein